MTADLSALIARLEAAEAGSRELDAEIWLRLNRPEYTGGVKALEMRGWYDGRGHLILETDDGEEVADRLYIDSVTTSLDAALALAERAGVCRLWNLWKSNSGYVASFEGDKYSRSPTPALALCIAILKAKMETEK